MLAGIQITEIEVGTGAIAERGKVVRVHFRGYGPQGNEVLSTHTTEPPQQVHLGKREFIVGIERGIEGMRVGGRRRLEIIAELAGGRVAGDELLRVEVELLEVRNPGERKPEDYTPGKFVTIFRPGEAARKLCRWQLSLHESGAGSIYITHPLPDQTWRHARSKHLAVQWDPQVAKTIIASVQATLEAYPQECLTDGKIWSDTSEKANNISRDLETNKLCWSVSVGEREQSLSYSLREDSPALLKSEFYQIVNQAREMQFPGKSAAPPTPG